MQLKLSHLAGRLSRHLPKHRMIRRDGLAARLFVPWGCHYVASDLQELEQGRREPELNRRRIAVSLMMLTVGWMLSGITGYLLGNA